MEAREGRTPERQNYSQQTDRHVETKPQERHAASTGSTVFLVFFFGRHSNFPLPALFLKKHIVA